MSTQRLSGQSAVITGAAGGIGSEIARRLTSEGASVLLVDAADGVRALANELNAPCLQLDLSERGAGREIREVAGREFGDLNALINNAGIGRARGLSETDDDALERMIGVNLISVLRVTRDLIELLSRPGGRIISVSSTLGLAGHPGTTVYAAAKAGIAQMTRQLAAELGPEGILVNAVAPGAIDTPMTTERLHNDQFYRQSFVHSVPLRRAGTADEIASVIAFLASEDAKYVSGQVIAVDGGWLAGRHLARDYGSVA